MNEYTVQELEDLRLYLSRELQYYYQITGISFQSEFDELHSALANIYGLITNYKNNPDIIYRKILEFADLSDAHRLILNLIYFYTLKELLPYLGTEYEHIVVWRYSLKKKQI